jgi:glycosyltransferase involved in cell wall biosynthesis
MSKKILYLHQYFNTPGDNGSIRSYVIAKELIKAGYDVEMITSTRSKKILPKTISGIEMSWIKLNYSNKMSFPKRILIFSLFSFMSTYFALIKKYDFIYATSTPITIGIPALIAKVFRNKKFIFEVRDVWPEVPIQMGIIKNPIIKKILFRFVFQLYKKASLVIPLSKGMANMIIKNYNFDHSKIFTVENGSDSGYFKTNDSEINYYKSKFNFSLNKKYIIYTGTFGLVNNLDYVIKLAEKLINTDIHFILVGTGSEEKKLKEASKLNMTLNKNVFFIDPVSKNEVFKLINCCDALISTVQPIKVLYDNSANKFFDGLRAGKMIIINHLGWQKEFIEKTNSGISLPLNPTKAASLIKKNFNDKTYLKMGLNAKHNSHHFEYDILFKGLVNKIIKHL